MNTSLIQSAIKAAKLAADLVPMGGVAVQAATAVLDLVNDLRETASASPDQVAEFEANREELEQAVNAHADKTAASLA